MPENLELADLAELPQGATDAGGPRTARDLEAVYDIPVTVSAVLGKATMQVNQLLKLGRGAGWNSTANLARPSTSTSTTASSRVARW